MDKGHIAVGADDGRPVAFDTKDYRDIAHGYAATIHKTQGMTVDRAQVAMRAMQLETEIRMDPFQRTDRFVEGWQRLQRAHDELVRDGNFGGAKSTAQQMAGMAKSLAREILSLKSVLSGRDRRDLGLEAGERLGRSLSSALADSISHDLGREISRGLGMNR